MSEQTVKTADVRALMRELEERLAAIVVGMKSGEVSLAQGVEMVKAVRETIGAEIAKLTPH